MFIFNFFLFYIKNCLFNTYNLKLINNITIYWFLGGKTKEGYSIITFPDTGHFVDLPDEGYEKLVSYITSVPS